MGFLDTYTLVFGFYRGHLITFPSCLKVTFTIRIVTSVQRMRYYLVWFDTIAWPGPVCTFSCLYIFDLAELYYSRVFCACANPARNGVTQILQSQSLLSNRRGATTSLPLASVTHETFSDIWSCLPVLLVPQHGQLPTDIG